MQIKKIAANKKQKKSANKKSCCTQIKKFVPNQYIVLFFSAGTMFCSRCGKKAREESKYCSACGLFLQQSSVAGRPVRNDSESKQPAVKCAINFQEFLKGKAESRKEYFKFRPKSAKKEKVQKRCFIGIMRNVNETLKFCRGPNLPVTVSLPVCISR